MTGNPQFRAVVVGAGPAGRALAQRLAVAGVSTTLVDPAPHRRWAATYAGWSDEFPEWLSPAAVAVELPSVSARARTDHEIARAYRVLDVGALQDALTLEEVRIVASRAARLDRGRVVLDDGRELVADAVFDARGGPDGGPRQTAFGVVVARSAADTVLADRDAVLMDWSGPDARGGSPSFLYAIPLNDTEILLEETCLAGDPALPVAELRDRLRMRIGALAERPRRTETVSFTLLPRHRRPWRTLVPEFGAAGGLKNPVTGYSVGASLAAADPVARAVAGGREPMASLWSRPARAVHRLRLRGLAALLALDPTETVDFFDTFLALPVAAQRAYLTGRTDVRGVTAAMGRVFAASDTTTRLTLARESTRPRPWADEFADR
ncbi:lycopene cyclase family protein [Gordonia jinhuaensis]|uniref:Lycopene cyclase n=1 Tax=Gordonia jinhuaensis TaxID=1517702 RepID=A0A916WR41_9ACTN|nr:lycopene cyclase family protein [Gordonia jinhuaensis]GGB24754.1 lycopene cyclase [Gordonia jinhuaensis]